MLVLGIDPGTRHLGYGLIKEEAGILSATDYGSLNFSPSLPIEQRLHQIHSHILNMINMFNPSEIAVEEPFLGTGNNQFVGPAFAIGQAQAAVLIAAASNNLPIFRYAPTKIKSVIANHGQATKEQIKSMIILSLSLTVEPDSTDASDALAAALCHIRHRDLETILNRQIEP